MFISLWQIILLTLCVLAVWWKCLICSTQLFTVKKWICKINIFNQLFFLFHLMVTTLVSNTIGKSNVKHADRSKSEVTITKSETYDLTNWTLCDCCQTLWSQHQKQLPPGIFALLPCLEFYRGWCNQQKKSCIQLEFFWQKHTVSDLDHSRIDSAKPTGMQTSPELLNVKICLGEIKTKSSQWAHDHLNGRREEWIKCCSACWILSFCFDKFVRILPCFKDTGWWSH